MGSAGFGGVPRGDAAAAARGVRPGDAATGRGGGGDHAAGGGERAAGVGGAPGKATPTRGICEWGYPARPAAMAAVSRCGGDAAVFGPAAAAARFPPPGLCLTCLGDGKADGVAARVGAGDGGSCAGDGGEGLTQAVAATTARTSRPWRAVCENLPSTIQFSVVCRDLPLRCGIAENKDYKSGLKRHHAVALLLYLPPLLLPPPPLLLGVSIIRR